MKILLQGDYVARYHPLDTAEGILREKLRGHEITVSNSDGNADPSGYAVCIQYTDKKAGTLSDQLAAKWLEFLHQGGCILSIHYGVSFFEEIPALLEQVSGARFVSHPPRCDINFTVKPPFDMCGAPGEFTLFEEPYQLELSADAEITQFLTYSWNSRQLPAGWMRDIGRGRYVYLMPGHDSKVWQDQAFQSWLDTCLRLCM